MQMIERGFHSFDAAVETSFKELGQECFIVESARFDRFIVVVTASSKIDRTRFVRVHFIQQERGGSGGKS